MGVSCCHAKLKGGQAKNFQDNQADTSQITYLGVFWLGTNLDCNFMAGKIGKKFFDLSEIVRVRKIIS